MKNVMWVYLFEMACVLGSAMRYMHEPGWFFYFSLWFVIHVFLNMWSQYSDAAVIEAMTRHCNSMYGDALKMETQRNKVLESAEVIIARNTESGEENKKLHRLLKKMKESAARRGG